MLQHVVYSLAMIETKLSATTLDDYGNYRTREEQYGFIKAIVKKEKYEKGKGSRKNQVTCKFLEHTSMNRASGSTGYAPPRSRAISNALRGIAKKEKVEWNRNY